MIRFIAWFAAAGLIIPVLLVLTSFLIPPDSVVENVRYYLQLISWPSSIGLMSLYGADYIYEFVGFAIATGVNIALYAIIGFFIWLGVHKQSWVLYVTGIFVAFGIYEVATL